MDSDTSRYDLNLGSSGDYDLIANNLSKPNFIADVGPFYEYYWRVIAKNEHGNSTIVPSWHFRAGGSK